MTRPFLETGVSLFSVPYACLAMVADSTIPVDHYNRLVLIACLILQIDCYMTGPFLWPGILRQE